MKSVQMGTAALDPDSPVGALSSKPTHTTTSRSAVKPANHASRRSLVVPVLPAASAVNPIERAAAAVPLLSTPRIMLTTRYVDSGRATREAAGRFSWTATLRSSTTLSTVVGDTLRPPLARMLYAAAISSGVASKDPSAMAGYGLTSPPIAIFWFHRLATRS